MALPISSPPPSIFYGRPPAAHHRLGPLLSPSPTLRLRNSSLQLRTFSPLRASPRRRPARPADDDEEPEKGVSVTDEWGEPAVVTGEEETAAPESDPPIQEDEWGKDGGAFADGGLGDSNASVVDKNADLKRCLVDSFYGTEFGLKASTETRAEVVELINQLEAANPTPAPTEAAALDGNWILLYTAFSELVPLIAAGTLPLLKLKRISQEIDTSSSAIKNTATFTGPLGSFSFSALATFEVRSPSRIQVQFKEGIIPPPELSPSINLPKVDVYGMKVDLTPVERSLKPLEDLVANIGRTISGQPPLKLPIPGERTQSWLVITYLDDDLRISRGDGGLFVLVKEGSPLSAGV